MSGRWLKVTLIFNLNGTIILSSKRILHMSLL